MYPDQVRCGARSQPDPDATPMNQAVAALVNVCTSWATSCADVILRVFSRRILGGRVRKWTPATTLFARIRTNVRPSTAVSSRLPTPRIDGRYCRRSEVHQSDASSCHSRLRWRLPARRRVQVDVLGANVSRAFEKWRSLQRAQRSMATVDGVDARDATGRSAHTPGTSTYIMAGRSTGTHSTHWPRPVASTRRRVRARLVCGAIGPGQRSARARSSNPGHRCPRRQSN